jgi:hypothetical protein
VKDLKVRKTAAALKTIKGLPKLTSLEVGKVPTLMDLGLDASKSTRHVSSGSFTVSTSGPTCLQ